MTLTDSIRLQRQLAASLPKPEPEDGGTFTHTEYFDRPTRPSDHCGLKSCAINRTCSFPDSCASARER